jgi:hypothetical protein
MAAKFKYVGPEPKEVKVPTGTFVAEPEKVYEVRGRDVPHLIHHPDFERRTAVDESEEPTWLSRS